MRFSRHVLAVALLLCLGTNAQVAAGPQGGSGSGGVIPPRAAVHPGIPAPGKTTGTTPICPPRTMVR